MKQLYFGYVIFLLLLVLLYIISTPLITALLINYLFLSLILSVFFLFITFIIGYFYRKNTNKKSAEYIGYLYKKYARDKRFKSSENFDGYGISKIAKELSVFEAMDGNTVEILENGAETFETVFLAIDNARHHIHVENFIIREDVRGTKFINLIVKKAQQGVKVRIILDGIAARISRKTQRKMKNSGIELYMLKPLLFSIFTGNLNNRHHRKLFVIDGKIGFTGGLNIGDEYLGKKPNVGFWRDTYLKITGPTVKQLQCIFMGTLYSNTGIKIDNDEFFDSLEEYGNKTLQIVNFDPGSKIHSMHLLFLNMINCAQKNIYITTPYLVFDNAIYYALLSALFKGVKIKIIIPRKPDEPLATVAHKGSLLFAQKLASAGAEVFFYKKGFIHAKILIIDNMYASVGTANFNNRSMHLDYEDTVLIYDSETVGTIIDDFNEDIGNSFPAENDNFKAKGFLGKVINVIALAFSPLE